MTRHSTLHPLFRSSTSLVGVFMLGFTPAYATDFLINAPTTSSVFIGSGDNLIVTANGSIVASHSVTVTSANVGAITNAGVINGSPGNGILLQSNCDITGGIINSGTITGANGISSDGTGGVISGGLLNSGSIIGTTGNGVFLFTTSGVTNLGAIDNSGTITGASNGVALGTGSLFSLQNSGNIHGGSNAGVLLNSASIAGGFTNSGTITGSIGVRFNGNRSMGGSFINTGTISGSNGGINVTGTGFQITGGLTNSGTIYGGSGNGLYLQVSSANITNGAITNSGTISSNSASAMFIGTGTYDSITNAATGVITSTTGTGLRLGAILTNGLVNHGTITGATGLVLTSGSNAGGITNTGTIQGTAGTAISLQNIVNPVNITLNGGRVIGDITDNDNANGFSNVTVAGDFATEGNITVSSLTVTNGTSFTIGGGDTVNIFTMPSSPGGTFVFGVNNSASHGLLTVGGGAADFSGATIAVNYTGGAIVDGDEYLIVQGGADVVGGPGSSLTTVTDNSYLWNFQIADGSAASAPTDAEDLFLFVSKNNSVQYTTPGNQAAGNVIQSLAGTGNTQLAQVVSALNSAPDEATFNAVAEAAQPGMDGSTFLTSQNFAARSFDLAGTRLATAGGTSPSAFTPSLSATERNWFAINGRGDTSIAALNPASGGEEHGIGYSGLRASGDNVWIQAFGQSIRQQERQGFAGYRANTGGVAIGADTANLFADAVLGVSFSYGDTRIKSENANSTLSEIDNYQVSLYGSLDLGGPYYLRGMAGYGRNDVSTQRRNVGGVSGLTADGDYQADHFSVQATVGRDYDVDGLTLSPHLLTSYTHYLPDDYTETGAGGANLQVKQKSVNNLEIGAGINLQQKYELEDGATLTPEFRTGVRYSLIRDVLEATSTFTGGGASFGSQGPTLPRASGNLGTGVTYSPDQNTDLTVSYDFQVKDDYQAHSAYLMSSFRF